MLRRVLRRALVILSTWLEPIRSRLRNRIRTKVASRDPERADSGEGGFPLLVLMTYRAKNAKLIQALLNQIDQSADVRLWALDEVAAELADHTVGLGPGSRFANFNRLYQVRPVREGSWTIFADDDVIFTKGNLTQTVSLMRAAGFSLAQPGHSVLSWWTNLFNVARPFLYARETNYVEQGPILVADPAFTREIMPLPENVGMGWGIEAEWYRVKKDRYRVGIIDACRMAHWDRNATTYDATPELKSMEERLANSGLTSMWQLQSTDRYWWKWQRRPQWVDA